MGPSGNNKVGLKCMTRESMKKAVRQIWDDIPMPDTVIVRVNAIEQGQPNDLDFLDHRKRPVG